MSFIRAKWALKRIGRDGCRRLRRGLRSVIPFRLRQSILNLTGGPQAAEKPASRFPFPPAGPFDVLCFPVIDWDFRFQRPQQLLREFARDGHRVFYAHTTFHQAGASPLVREITENIYRVRLPGPGRLREVFKGEADGQALDRFLSALDELRLRAGIQECVIFAQFPYWAELALAARDRWGWKVVYDCMDEQSGFADAHPATPRREERLLAQSDLVVATSRRLYEKARRASRRALLIPNGADFDHFNRSGPGGAGERGSGGAGENQRLRTTDYGLRTYKRLAGLRGPVIGYYGAIAEWFDVEMIREAARARPGWQFVLIGEVVNASADGLKRLPNVLLTGEVPYAELPAFLQRFDVACIPFLRTPLTEATNPVKFYEYLSAGKPVVAVLLPDLEPYQEYFYSVRDRAGFVPQVEAALREESPEKVEARLAFARNHTWRARYRQLQEGLELLLRSAKQPLGRGQ